MAQVEEGLSPLGAYEAIMRFSQRRGEWALRLALHAALPQVLRPELVHLLRLNFVGEALDDPALEADVLFAPFCLDLGNGYFRFDPNARLQLLSQLDPTYEAEPEQRSFRVARFLLAWLGRQNRQLNAEGDPLYTSYVEVERWSALAFYDADDAAQQLAAALRQACDPKQVSARFRIGGLATALATPLVAHQRLLVYAEAIEALQAGDVGTARENFDVLGRDEIRIGNVTLRAGSEVLGERAPEETGSTAQANVEASPGGRIFVSYRRRDSQHAVVRLVDKLRADFGTDAVSSTRHELRGNIMESLRRAVRQCSVMVVVIGPLWLLSADGDEKSDRTDDIVRIEVSIALESGIGIFPILIAPASFPRAEDLPPDLRKLVDYRGHALRIDSWEGDYAALRERLRTIVEKPQEGPIAERPLLIYLSSTVSDLQNHRAAVTQALTGLGHRVVHNESYEMGGRFRRRPRASDSSTFDLPFRYIAECDVFICMVAWRYEADPEPESNPAGTSVVEREYRKARELGKPILPFLLREDVPWPEAHVDGIIEGRDARVHAFRELLWREHTVGIFSSVEDLVAKAATSLSRFKEARALPARDSSPAAEAPQRVLVFVGHTIDVPARVEPRFPESVISAAYNAIADVVKQELATGNVTLGIASGSHGGDLLFHQVCADLGIRTQLFLPLAPDEFSQRYVAPAGTEWVERFRRARHSETKVGSFRTSGDTRVGFHDVWQQNSDAMLDGARAPGGEVVLIALWDREAAGGPTYLVQRANMLGIRTIVIDSKQLLQSRLPTRPRLKIYMSIAWDVVEERHIAQAVLETLSHATWLKDRATLEIATWDPSLPFVDEEAPMLNYEDHPPGEADLFVVILWGRLGVPIHVSESHPPLSAVQYELGEAISHGREVFVYQRTGKPRANVDDPDLDERVRQYESVLDFVKEQRQAGRFVSTYDSPADFRAKFEHQLSAYLRAKLQVDA